MRISSDFDFIQKFAKIFEFSIVMPCLSIRLVTMRMLNVRILLLCVSAQHKHMLSISIVKVKNS
jgi:hypothetical protein